MNIRSIPLHTSGVFLLVCLLTGCVGGTSQRSVYYLLTASRTLPALQSSASGIGIGVGPVKLPGFLDRPEIVTRQGENHLLVNEFHRWGDSLESQIDHVLAENLSIRLDTIDVVIYPWERALAPKYQLYIDFRRFDGKPGGSFALQAIWWVVGTADDKRLVTRRSSILVPTENNTFESYVAAQSIALEKLSLEIGKVLIDTVHSNM